MTSVLLSLAGIIDSIADNGSQKPFDAEKTKGGDKAKGLYIAAGYRNMTALRFQKKKKP